jgi:hypothetical protein
MILIKKTKSVEMYYIPEDKNIMLTTKGIMDKTDFRDTLIPMRSVFQVKRGLETAVQKFYRKVKHA